MGSKLIVAVLKLAEVFAAVLDFDIFHYLYYVKSVI